jgi:hypothetical protein
MERQRDDPRLIPGKFRNPGGQQLHRQGSGRTAGGQRQKTLSDVGQRLSGVNYAGQRPCRERRI